MQTAGMRTHLLAVALPQLCPLHRQGPETKACSGASFSHSPRASVAMPALKSATKRSLVMKAMEDPIVGSHGIMAGFMVSPASARQIALSIAACWPPTRHSRDFWQASVVSSDGINCCRLCTRSRARHENTLTALLQLGWFAVAAKISSRVQCPCPPGEDVISLGKGL